MMALHRVSWCKLRLRALTRARIPWPPLLLLMLSALCHILCQAVVVANAKLPDSLDETVLPPPPPPPETLAAAWPNAEDPLTPTAPATASLVMATALRLVPAVTDFNSFLALLFLAIFIAALIFLLVFHVTLNWRPFQKYGRTGSGKGNNALTTTGESSDCQLTPATPTASSPLPSDRTSHLHPYPHPSLPVNATTSSCLPCVCFRPLCCCCTSCDFFCCLAPPIQPVTTASAAKTACSHFSPTLSRDIKAADSVSTFFQQDHTTPTNGSDPQISPSVPATPPHCDNGFTGCEPALPTSHLPQPVPVGALSQRRMISVPSLSQLSQVGQPEHVQPLGFDGGQLAAALPLADISAGSFNGGVATSGFLHLRSAAVCVIPQQGGVASAPRTPLFSQSAVVGLHRLSTISASLSDVASASAAAQTAELSTDSKAVLGRSADEVGAPAADHRRPKPAMPFLPSSANSVATDSASFDALKRSFTTSGASRGPKRSLLESRRGSHTSLTLVLSPTISSSHATLQPSMPNSYGVHGPTSFLAPRGHRTTRFSPMAAATTSPVSLHRPCGAAGDADTAAFSPEDSSSSSNLQSQPRQHQQLQQHPGNQGAAEGFITAAGTATDHKLLCQSSLPLTGQQLETKLREDVASLFSEFWSIPTNLTSRNQCGLAGVGQKNRYAGIIPNNETRVILPQTNNDELTTYINANYIHGYAGVPRAFIATQGPMMHTVNDFWRMIWHTRASAIVMLSRLVESGKVKCEFYLPDSKFEAPTGRSGPGRADTVPGGTASAGGGSASTADPPTAAAALFLKSANSFPSQRGGVPRKFVGRIGATDEEETDLSRTCARAGSQQMFGSVLVRVDSVILKPGYTKRIITLKHGDEEHKVTHFWYVAWPDHSSPEATPTAARHLLHLVHETEACRYGRPDTSGVHRIPQSLSSPSTPSAVVVGSPPPTLRRPPPPRRFQRQQAEERTDAEVVDLLSEEEEAQKPDFYSLANRGYRGSDPLAVAAGPVVVHCSAGIGRTGCFIALCIGCEQLRREDKVDVFGIVNRLRLDRGGMVEDHSQYVFLHIALATFYSLQRGLAPPEFPVMDLSLGFPRPGR